MVAGYDSVMERPRFYCNPIAEPVAELAGPEARHLASVRRLGIGERVELFDGEGKVATAVIKRIERRKVELVVEVVETYETRGTGRIVIAASITKGERFNWLVEKCTELGVDRITPVVFERTVKLGPQGFERWRRVAISACKQSGRVFLPQIDGPMSVPDAIESLKKDHPKARFIYGSFSADADAVVNEGFGDTDVVGLVGPEGGLTGKEKALLEAADFAGVRLTGPVLRLETAAVALAAVLAVWRDAGKAG
jgi:16S rRNA (uracil1498-N3)-methyltransferase